MINFNNTYSKLPSNFFEPSIPEKFKNINLFAFNHKLAKELGMKLEDISDQDLASIFSGEKILSGSAPISLAYAAHQFGHFVPKLGDGRATLLGEVSGFDIQLKGSGRTKFSRSGDGRSALGPVVREYILSESMHNLGVPTTRALAGVTTGELVQREYSEPGGIFTRVAASHIRVGTFQYFAVREDKESLKTLLNYTISRHFSKLENLSSLSEKALGLIESVVEVQSNLIAKWMSLGFIHGVMNTDNFSVAGLTLDYGPCAFLDEYKSNKVFSSVDRNGRYAYKNQVEIAKCNILRLSECLLPLIDDNQKRAIELLTVQLEKIFPQFETKRWSYFARKFGIESLEENDILMIEKFLKHLEENELDFTNSFRNIGELRHTGDEGEFGKSAELSDFVSWWRDRIPELPELSKINPWIIPRNHQVEKAIQASYGGDFSTFDRLNDALSRPYDVRAQYEDLTHAPLPSERVAKTFCGT